jgi:hypothetical protein
MRLSVCLFAFAMFYYYSYHIGQHAPNDSIGGRWREIHERYGLQPEPFPFVSTASGTVAQGNVHSSRVRFTFGRSPPALYLAADARTEPSLSLAEIANKYKSYVLHDSGTTALLEEENGGKMWTE